MLLSIVMMIKNEEKVLENSLKALVPLMKLVESELIILDTGSTDNSVEIAKKYTDKVYYKEWTKNFAEMRNESIKYARGKWILILDADEELIDYSNLVKFFNENIYEKYNSASIELKNIVSEDKKMFNTIMLPRLFRKTSDFRYEGAIHEQPIFKLPIFNRVAIFNHYGYLFIDEELKQRKSKRNKEILFEELKKDENNPYINYQLGKDFDVSGESKEALYYLEKSKNLYSKSKKTPIFVFQDIARLYFNMGMDEKCIDLCNEYIKQEDKNIDMYCYLASSQMRLRKYKKSIENYNRYIYLINNYEITTQANDITCAGNTVSDLERCKENIIKCYFNLENYNEVINSISEISEESISNLYYLIFMSLYKENKLEDIKNIYIKYSNTNVEKEKIIKSIEALLSNVKIDERESIYKILSEIEDDYGKLNSIRLGNKIKNNDIENILKNNNQYCYGDLIYYSIDQFEKIEKILENLNSVKIEKFISHIIANRRDCILKLYEYVIKAPLRFELKHLKLLSIILKCLLCNSGLMGEKYNNIFILYITYSYEYLRKVYSEQITDEELIYLVKDIESEFILTYINIQKTRDKDPLSYVKEMKSLLVNNQHYEKGIKFTIDKFEKEFNESLELKELKKKYKVIIEEAINNEKIEDAEKLIKDYEEIFKYDDINNIKSIISIYRNDIKEAEKYLKLAYCYNRNDKDLLFNIAYIRESQGNIEDAIIFYEKLLDLEQDSSILEKIKFLESKIEENIDSIKLEHKKYIEQLINKNSLEEARLSIQEYTNRFGEDVNTYSMEGIILLNEGQVELASEKFINGLEIDNNNVDLLYNIGYSSLALGYIKEAIYYYNRCLNLTDDNELKSEVKNILKEINNERTKNSEIIIDIGLDNNKLLENIKEEFIKININEKIEKINTYYNNENIVYETNLKNLKSTINEVTKDYNKYSIIFSDYKLGQFIDKKENCKLIYITDINLSTNKKDYLNQNINIYFEKETCDKVDFIFTNNISVYCFKTLIEKRKNVYFINENLGLNEQINFNNKLVDELSFSNIVNRVKNICDEYEKGIYYLISVKSDPKNCIEIIKEIYEKYNTEESYKLYISLLNHLKKYDEMILVAINSSYCEDVYKSELKYLNSIKEYDLIEFIINMSLKNYKYIDHINSNNLDYKMALYLYELMQFNKAYEKYINVINQKESLRESPLVNRNISFLMYKNNDYKYEEYYNKYKKLILDINNKYQHEN